MTTETDNPALARHRRIEASLATGRKLTGDLAHLPAAQQIVADLVQVLEDTHDWLINAEVYQPDITPQSVAVPLDEENHDWDAIARWCGGTIHSGPSGDSGEWDSWIVIPGAGEVSSGMWIVRHPGGRFTIHSTIGEATTE